MTYEGEERRNDRAENISADEFHKFRRRVDDRITMVEGAAIAWNSDRASNREQLTAWCNEHEKRTSERIAGLEATIGGWIGKMRMKLAKIERREFALAVLVAADVLVLSCAIVVIITHT